MTIADAHPSASNSVATAAKSAPARDVALDFVKGVLVVFMVIYHAMNIFSTAGFEAYAYIRFVSGSFILLSGYIVASFGRQAFEAAPRPTTRRLITRGLKLVALFVALNGLIWATGVGNPNKSGPDTTSLPQALLDVFVTGKAGVASFQILLPIAYVLIAAPLFLALRKYALAILIVAFAATAVLDGLDSNAVNPEFALMGAIGLAGGLLLRPGGGMALANLWLSVVALAAVIAAMRFLSLHLMLYTLGTLAVLKLLHDIGSRVPLEGSVGRSVVLLGQYSLVGYIGQIVVLQLSSSLLSRPQWDLGWEVAVAVLVTILVLLLSCKALTFIRARSALADRAYKLVFS